MKIDPHPLGFSTIDLVKIAGCRIRLHLWRRGATVNEGRHSHRWPFVSLPLFGRFVDIRYDSVEGDRYQRLTCHPPERFGERRMVPVGRGDLVERKCYVRWPLVPYRCRAGQIHSFGPAGRGLHVSLVFLGRARSNTSEVWQIDPPKGDET